MLERLRALLAGVAEREEEAAVAGAKVIVGLGNPGREYDNTRHNAGWWLLDVLAQRWGVPKFRAEKNQAIATTRVEPFQVRLIKPLTYMNRSGSVLVPLKRMGALDLGRDLLVLVDDVALEPGRVRFRPSGSAGGHNGLKSIEQALGTKDYPRLRIGVGTKPPGADLADWVLSSMPRGDRKLVDERLPELAEAVETWMRDGIEVVMDRYNR
ncbi:MAG TPA: aminoacyl-tRNA hydrolase [Longimicrobium sp.]|uniref:aminoacyl-tRNA hydrolase n=1 Tax=Longimicrobium sp. TaxID=2029185 RepID=UPI002EDB6308